MTPAAFRALFPAFVDATDDEINAALALAPPYFNVARWGGFYTEGLGNFVAHKIVVGRSDSTDLVANDLTAEDRPTIKFTRDPKLLQGQADDEFERTKFGQRYRQMSRKYVGVGALVV